MEQNSPSQFNNYSYLKEQGLSTSQSQVPSRYYSIGYRNQNHSPNLQPSSSYLSQSSSQYDEYPSYKESITRSSSIYSQQNQNSRQMTYQPSYSTEGPYGRVSQQSAIPTPNIPRLASSPSSQFIPSGSSTTVQQNRNSHPYNHTAMEQTYSRMSPSPQPTISPQPPQYEAYRDINENFSNNPIVDSEKETLRNIEFKYLRLIQEVLFLVTKYSSRTKSDAQNTELMALTNELLNAVQRHTAEPLERISTFQKPTSIDEIREKNQNIISLYQKKISYLTNRVVSLENEPVAEDSLDIISKSSADIESQKKKQANTKSVSPLKNEEAKLKREKSIPDYLKQQKSVVEFFLKSDSTASSESSQQTQKNTSTGNEKGWWLPEQEEVEPWEYKSDRESTSKSKSEARRNSSGTTSVPANVETPKGSSLTGSEDYNICVDGVGDSKRKTASVMVSPKPNDSGNSSSSSRSEKSEKSERLDKASDLRTKSRNASKDERESEASIEEFLLEIAPDYQKEKEKRKKKKEKERAENI